MTFAGFPARAQATAIPNVFFADLMPQLARDPVALGMALHAFRLLQAKRGFPRFLAAGDFESDTAAMAFLSGCGADAGAIDGALRRCVELGVLLPLAVEAEGIATELFFLNAPADRRGLEMARAGAIDIGAVVRRSPVTPRAERSNIFTLYESLIGTLSPLIADELAEAERLYPPEWLERAFREAAGQNARSWRYVSRILERWAAEGPGNEKADGDPSRDDRYLSGKYGRILKRRLQP